MNRDRIEGVWKQIRGRLKQRWGVLSSSRLSAVAGAQSQLAGRIQERCGIAREESRRQLNRFLHRNRIGIRATTAGVRGGFRDNGLHVEYE